MAIACCHCVICLFVRTVTEMCCSWCLRNLLLLLLAVGQKRNQVIQPQQFIIGKVAVLIAGNCWQLVEFQCFLVMWWFDESMCILCSAASSQGLFGWSTPCTESSYFLAWTHPTQGQVILAASCMGNILQALICIWDLKMGSSVDVTICSLCAHKISTWYSFIWWVCSLTEMGLFEYISYLFLSLRAIFKPGLAWTFGLTWSFVQLDPYLQAWSRSNATSSAVISH